MIELSPKILEKEDNPLHISKKNSNFAAENK